MVYVCDCQMRMFMNTDYNSVLSYKGLYVCRSAAHTLRKGIKPAHVEDFKAIIDSLKNSSAETVLSGKSGNSAKLCARVTPVEKNLKEKRCSQRLFESTMHFLKRICKKSVEMDTKLRSSNNFNMDEILKKL